MKIFLSGKMVEEKDAVVSVFDHGLLYGDGVFEGIRAYNGRVFLLDEHIERLFDSAKAIALEIPMTMEEMSQAVVDTCKANDISDGYIRLIVTRGKGTLGLNPYLCTKAEVIIIAATIQLYPQELYDNGLKIVTVGTIRNHPEAINPRIKSLNYLNNVMAKIEAINAGCMECLMLNHKGEVAEASGDNVFVIKKGVITTPPSSLIRDAQVVNSRDILMERVTACERARGKLPNVIAVDFYHVGDVIDVVRGLNGQRPRTTRNATMP